MIKQVRPVLSTIANFATVETSQDPVVAKFATTAADGKVYQVAKHDSDIAELKDKVDFFVQTKEPPLQSIFYQNKFWDAKSLLIKFIRRAKKELVVVDAYPGVATLDMLAKRGRGVKIELADLRSQNVTSKVDVKEAA